MTEAELLKQALDYLRKTTSKYSLALENNPSSYWGKAFDTFQLLGAALAPAPVPDPTPTPPPPPPATAWGFSAHALHYGAGADAYVKRLADCGATVLRDDVYVGASPGVMDTIANLAKAHGCTLDLILANNVAKKDPASFASGAYYLVAYFDTHYPDLLRAVEPMNEPNGNAYKTDPAGYAALVSAVTDAVHKLNSKTKVWAGTSGLGQSPGSASLDWTEAVLAAGCRFDEWSCHPYRFWTGCTADAALDLTAVNPWSQVFWQGDTLAATLARHGYTGPIHATEVGIPTDAWPSGTRISTTTSEAEQAKWFPKALSQWRSQARAGVFLFYTGQDDNSGDTANRELHFGAYHSDGTAKPVVAAMKAGS